MKSLLLAGVMIMSANVFAGEINVKVQGMVCSMCAQGIQKKFSDVKEVKHIDVNLDQKVVKILTEEGKSVDDKTITKLISEAGYHVANIERK